MVNLEKLNVVLVGASAGGVKLIEKLLLSFENLPKNVRSNMVIVICQHLSEASKSLMKEIIERSSSGFEVVELFQTTKIENNKCYLNQPGRHTTYENGELVVREFSKKDREEPTFIINKCFQSFARNITDYHLIFGVVLS